MAGISDPSALLPRFGLSDFRPGQREVVDAIAEGADVMCVMPTGGGKSLCYQLPSLSRDGITIVISPLIALMKDQVDGLQALGIRAALINSSLTVGEQADVMRQMSAGDLDLVYVAPERLRNGRFLESISSAKVTLLAVDEAHCVSEWGHDFRPDYSRLGQFRQRYLNNVQTIALTATATPAVRQDISVLLGLDAPRVFVTGFSRPNLRFSVTHAKSDREKDEQLINDLQSQSGAGIIYAATRKRCEEIADWLPEKLRRPIGVYHAGLESAQRKRVQEDFMSGKLSAIVATNAFGMGIDKADIRFVIHYNMPGSLEAYYQEAGRAGRDGQASDCRLLFSYHDRYIQEFFIENRYPSRETVRSVYEFLLSREEDPIEMTLDQVRDAIKAQDGGEAIGTAETLLAKAGVLKRLDSNSNQAIVRIDSDAPTMLDFLPKEAKLRRRVMQAIETVVGTRRGEDVYVRPSRLAEIADVDRDQLSRTLRELKRLKAFDYVPPFRGRAIHIVQRDVPFEQLDIDFDELERRKAAEYEKLETVIGFARTSGCRQRVILSYFGEKAISNCGTCDRCSPADGSIGRGSDVSLTSKLQGVDPDDLIRGARVVLSGVTRMHGRFGKNLVAQMLCGSKSKKLQQWKLHRLSTYGLLSALKQTEVAAVMDSLIEAGLLEQKEVDERRPTIHITESGRRVMHQQDPLPDAVTMPFPLARRLAIASRTIESQDVQTQSAGSQIDEVDPAASAQTTDLIERLKRWRRKTSAALGIPAYRVLTNATIERIAESVPDNSEQLVAVPGVGPATIEQFGHDIVELIREARLQSDADTDQAMPPPIGPDTAKAEPDTPEQDPEAPEQDPEAPEQDPDLPGQEPDAPEQEPDAQQKAPSRSHTELPSPHNEDIDDQDQPDAYWTWRLFRDGYRVGQIASIRRCDPISLRDDLAVAAAAGLPVDSSWMSLPEQPADPDTVADTPPEARIGR